MLAEEDEVRWQDLEPEREYKIQAIVGPNTPLSSIQNSVGVPLGQKKVGVFVRIVDDHGTPFAVFKNLRNPPRDIEGPYLPSVLGTATENMFSVLSHRFYRSVHEGIALKQVGRQFGNITNTNVGEDVILRNPYLGGKKARRNKKSKRTKKGKRSKKSRKNKKRH